MRAGHRGRWERVVAAALGLSGCPQNGEPQAETGSTMTTQSPETTAGSTTANPTDSGAPETTDPTTDSATSSGSTTTTNGSSTTSGCVPESDDALCAAAGAECGAVMREDACGVSREVECGGCPSAQSCQQNQCESVLACLDAALPECCESDRSGLNSCAMGACGVFWTAECIAVNCAAELTEYSDCVAYECDSAPECGDSCELFCAQTLACDPGPTWDECLAACEASDEALQIGCGIGLECAYNGACTQLPPSVCPDGQWRCEQIEQCVPASVLCDGHSDCLDDSDEMADECGSMDCGADAKLCEGACADCPVASGVAAYACDAGTCVVGLCQEGYLACDSGCCKEEQVTVENDDGLTVRIHVGGDGTVHLTYRLYNIGLRYARGTSDGKSWSDHRTLLADPEKFNPSTQMATDAADNIYVAMSPSGKPWRLATDKSGQWVTQECPPLVAEMFGLAIRPDQRPYAWMGGELWRRDDDIMQWTALTPAPVGGYCSTSAVADGQIHVVCGALDEESLLHHMYAPGLWSSATAVTATANTTVEVLDLAADKDGGLHLLYREETIGKYFTRYAQFVDGIWTDELVSDELGGARLAVYEPERPYITLKHDGDWYLGARKGGVWTFSPIEPFGPEIDIGALHSGNPILCAATYSDVIACRTAG